MKVVYTGLKFRNEGEKVVEIDVEGVIGGSFWEDDDPESKNTKEKMKAELKKISNLKADTIIVNINSYGGDVNHGLSIHDLLAEHKAKIITKINGMTASAATIIAMAGDERKISDNSLFLVHRAMSWAIGNINDVNMLADDLKKVDDRIINIYTKVTGNDKNKIIEVMDRNNGYGEWITPDEAREIGFVTDIFEPRKMAAFFSNEILNQFHLPPVPDSLLISPAKEDKKPAWVNEILSKLDGKKKIKNSNTKSMKKDYKHINKTLNVDKLKSSEDGLFLNEGQLQIINDKMAADEQTVSDAGAARTAAETAKTDAENARKTAEDALTDAYAELDKIDDSVKEAKTLPEKIKAIKVKLAAKPGAEVTGTVTDEDKIRSGNGEDWDTIDSLPHNKEADANL